MGFPQTPFSESLRAASFIVIFINSTELICLLGVPWLCYSQERVESVISSVEKQALLFIINSSLKNVGSHLDVKSKGNF